MALRMLRIPRRPHLFSAFLAFGLGASGSASAQSELANLPVQFVGPYQSGYTETAQRAVASAVAQVTDQGIGRKQIQRITVSPAGVPQEDRPLNLPPFRIWIAVEGCDDNVYFQVSPAGRIIAMYDKGGCLSRV